jgi:diacylglycerol kinase (ATP)
MSRINPPLVFNPTDKPKGVRRIMLAFKNSASALLWLISNEAAFRQEAVLLVFAIITLSLWPISLVEKALLLSSVLLVMFAEILNTAIETTIDRVSTDIHPLSGLAKDLGSASVLVAMTIACLMWVAVLITSLL